MGLTVLKIEVGNPAKPARTEEVEFLIDSGVIYSVVPARTLKRLGIKPLTTEEFRLADGTTIRRKKGVALFRFGERVGGADVIFGEAGDSVLLGAFTLEALGLSLDPLRRELRPLPMVLAPIAIHCSWAKNGSSTAMIWGICVVATSQTICISTLA